MTDPGTPSPRFNLYTAEFDELPDGAGWMKLLYESPDGMRKVGSFKEPGVFHEVMPFDELLFIVAGSTKISIEGGENFVLTAGDCCYFFKGQSVTFDNSDDFHDLSVFMKHGGNDQVGH
jgi:uncharacterized cupin superfamily protein